MTYKTLLFTCLASFTAFVFPASAAQWEEHLVTTSDTRAVKLGERQVTSYFGAGAGLLVGGDKMAPLGSYECAGMIDAGADGVSLSIDCVITDPQKDEVYLTVSRKKSDTFAAGTGVYQYVGGTGAWEGFSAECTYQVTYMPSGVHGVEIGMCEGDVLPPPLR